MRTADAEKSGASSPRPRLAEAKSAAAHPQGDVPWRALAEHDFRTRCELNCLARLNVSSAVWLTPITVECYAGAKADEVPRRFLWNGLPVEVEEVVDRWHQVESKPEWPRADYFKVRGSDQREYLLKHDLESDDWYLGRQW